jgi:peptidylprolyl isomerase
MLKKFQFAALTSAALLTCCQIMAHDSKTDHSEKTEKPAAHAQETSDNIDMKKLSEAFGHFIGRNLQTPGLKFDMESLIKGIREGAAGEPAPMSEKEEMMAAVQERAFKEMSSTNLKAANDFMEKNKQTASVKEIVPGKLQYMILEEGTGAAVTPNSVPLINYTGKYLDGTVFGTSEEIGGPITIPLNQTIPGFSKGIVGMKEGEKRRLFVHPDLGYGTSGQLPPNELLIFEVELVKADSDKGKGKDSDQDLGKDEDEESVEFDEEIDIQPYQQNSAKPAAQNR